MTDAIMADAVYRPQRVEVYRGNPFIEALPPIRTRHEAARMMQRLPPHSDGDRAHEASVRKHFVVNALAFLQPLEVHLELEERLARLIRFGYVGRNPADPRLEVQIDRSVHMIADDSRFRTARPCDARWAPVQSTGMTIVGMSGVGKSTAVSAVMGTYPQVIVHGRYAGRPLPRVQVVYLKLDCPHDGSVKGLCINFFQRIDVLLGTSYEKLYAGHRATTDVLLLSMARVAAVHGLGVLVIDEIQHLCQANQGGEARMLNFFVQLVNTIGVPVVLVGTFKAIGVLAREFRQARRGSAQGDIVWHPMAFGAEWQLFAESLWRYQYTKVPTPFTAELSKSLHAESAGIADLAVKLYMLSQLAAMETDDEFITELLMEETASASLQLTRPVVHALRTNDMEFLRSLDDVLPPLLSRLNPSHLQPADSAVVPAAPVATTADVACDIGSPSPGVAGLGRGRAGADGVSSRRRRKRVDTTVPADSLRGIAASGREQGMSVYEALSEAGAVLGLQEPSQEGSA